MPLLPGSLQALYSVSDDTRQTIDEVIAAVDGVVE